jgi:hypothetical protein
MEKVSTIKCKFGRVSASEEENLRFYHFWSFSNKRIIYHIKRYNCIFAIKATRATKNAPQQNHKFINSFVPGISSVVALASTKHQTQYKNINWYLYQIHIIQFPIAFVVVFFWLLVAQLLYVPFFVYKREKKGN